jgi:hypothetical protein
VCDDVAAAFARTGKSFSGNFSNSRCCHGKNSIKIADAKFMQKPANVESRTMALERAFSLFFSFIHLKILIILQASFWHSLSALVFISELFHKTAERIQVFIESFGEGSTRFVLEKS